ncbi:MAG: PIN domain-containing protein [bacterium]
MLFVDTNVFLYARHAREVVKQPLAAAWVERAWREQTGRTSIQVLSEYYVNVTRKIAPALSPDEAWDDVRALMTWDPLPADSALLTLGREIERRYRLSWWDSLIVGAAQMQGCALLLSEDLQDGAVFGGVTVRSPFTLAVREGATRYALPPLTAGGHPKRGRPRRRSGATVID